MIEQEVLYERNMTGSYMKIEASGTASFDERMLFSGKIPGILPAEQCFLNGKAWYWYNISGKQSLDTYCKVQDIGITLMEKVIISICDEIDIMEWNLFDLNCLLLSPEYIFINNMNQEVLFTVYPGSEDRLSDQFRDLMEYLLTKIDHKDMKAVKAAYDIYEKTLDEAYDIMEIRNYVISGRTKEDEKDGEKIGSTVPVTGEYEKAPSANFAVEEPAREVSVNREEDISVTDNKKTVFSDIMHIFNEWKSSIHRVKKSVAPGQEENQKGVYVSRSGAFGMGRAQRPLQVAEHIEYGRSSVEESVSGQTTVLSGYGDFVKGVLVYEGNEGLENISLQQRNVQIGKSNSSDVCIPRSTISQYHARISYKDGEYLLEDLNSTNGTYINEKALAYKEVRKLAMNDMVRFADVSYRFV